jgi:hypothetical protein
MEQHHRIVAFAGVLFMAGMALPQSGAWTNAQPPSSPPFRAGHGLAFEPSRGLVVAYGGVTDYTSTTVLSETWAFDGCTWSQIFPSAGNPGPRFNTYLAQSPTARRLILFGGSSMIGAMPATTWELDLEPDPPAWINMTPAGPSPTPRQNSPPVFDSWRNRTVLFGGTDAGAFAFYGDTWEWDGSAWHQITPSGPSPAPRGWHQMTFDPVRGRTVLYGGYNGGQLGDTWEWDGTHWLGIPTPTAPPARSSTSIAFDSWSQRVVLFGGSYGWPIGLNDTWEYDGTTWYLIPIAGPVPPHQYLHRVVGDPLRGGIIVHGAFGDGWTQPNTTWRYHRSNLGASTLNPSIGTSVNLELLIPADAGLAYVVAVSLSGTCPGFTLPDGRIASLNVDATTLLAFAGAYPAILQGFAGVLNATGLATPVLAIPALPGLSGLALSTEGITAAGPVVHTVTNALTITVQ